MGATIPADRFMAMIELIPRWPGEISTDVMHVTLLAAGYEVSLRTVQRNLEFMMKTDAGLERERTGKEPFRYRYKADAPVRISPSLDDHTALAFELADAFLHELMPPETVVALKPFVKEAGKRLMNRKQIAAATWKDKVHVFPLGLRRKAPRILPAVRDVVYQALLDDRVLRIFHASKGKKEPREFVISPLGLVVRDYLIYLYGLPREQNDREKKQVLAFALHRTRSAEIVPDGPYVSPCGFSLKEYEGLASMPVAGSSFLQLQLRIGASSTVSVRECELIGKQTLVPDTDVSGSGCSILHAEVPNTVELRQWIRSLGSDAEVLAPSFLRQEFAEEFAWLVERYGSLLHQT